MENMSITFIYRYSAMLTIYLLKMKLVLAALLLILSMLLYGASVSVSACEPPLKVHVSFGFDKVGLLHDNSWCDDPSSGDIFFEFGVGEVSDDEYYSYRAHPLMLKQFCESDYENGIETNDYVIAMQPDCFSRTPVVFRVGYLGIGRPDDNGYLRLKVDRKGYLFVVGQDAKGRKEKRIFFYHPEWKNLCLADTFEKCNEYTGPHQRYRMTKVKFIRYSEYNQDKSEINP